MKFFEIKKYELELLIIKNQLYIKNLTTKEIEKANIDYHKYALIYDPNQISKITILNSKYENIFIHKNIKNIKIINSTLDKIVISPELKELKEVYFIKNYFKKIEYASNILKIEKLITNIDKSLIEKLFNKKIKINYFKFIKIKENDNNMKRMLKNYFN